MGCKAKCFKIKDNDKQIMNVSGNASSLITSGDECHSEIKRIIHKQILLENKATGLKEMETITIYQHSVSITRREYARKL